MKIEHFGGLLEVETVAALDKVLDLRYGNRANEYLICGKDRYPLLCVQVRGAVACLHFFPEEGHPGFLSVGEGAAAGLETFYTNTPTEEIEVAADAVVSFDQAREAAREFFRSHVIPRSIRWVEL